MARQSAGRYQHDVEADGKVGEFGAAGAKRIVRPVHFFTVTKQAI